MKVRNDGIVGVVREPPLRANAALFVIPAHAGIQGLCFLNLSFRFIGFLVVLRLRYPRKVLWIPACAGMTMKLSIREVVNPFGGLFQQPSYKRASRDSADSFVLY